MSAKDHVFTLGIEEEFQIIELGGKNEMAHVERIMREGTGADRQLAAWERTQDMKKVVDQIVAETYEGLNVGVRHAG
jgi:gamma-glutamyl:cysteine ligase YbdK (ATP-grasp superfamily)